MQYSEMTNTRVVPGEGYRVLLSGVVVMLSHYTLDRRTIAFGELERLLPVGREFRQIIGLKLYCWLAQ